MTHFPHSAEIANKVKQEFMDTTRSTTNTEKESMIRIATQHHKATQNQIRPKMIVNQMQLVEEKTMTMIKRMITRM